ncbi:MAG: hypothetical protein JW969_15400 [Spirochaetales bacterium]|nr:hypothetical protein [Spirochaetales bacterium]
MLSAYISLAVFGVAYLIFIVFPAVRTWAALGAVFVLFVSQSIGMLDAFYAVNWNEMGIFVGTLAMSRKLKINPVLMMIGIAVSSNLQGTATLTGDPPSMLLGGFAKMNFMDSDDHFNCSYTVPRCQLLF